MNIERHIQASTLAGIAYFGATRSVSAGLCCLLAGVLIDTDHWIEYWHDCGINLNVKRMFQFCNSGTNSRFFILFHSYELILLCSLLATHYWRRPDIGGAILLGMGLHLLMDWWNVMDRFRYLPRSAIIFSFVYRLSRRFRRDLIEPEIRGEVIHVG